MDESNSKQVPSHLLCTQKGIENNEGVLMDEMELDEAPVVW